MEPIGCVDKEIVVTLRLFGSAAYCASALVIARVKVIIFGCKVYFAFVISS